MLTPAEHAQLLRELAHTFDYLAVSLTRCGWGQSDPVGSAKDATSRARQAAEEIEGQGGDLPSVGHILRLADIIREVDGNHSLGAAALAEAILNHSQIKGVPALARFDGGEGE